MPKPTPGPADEFKRGMASLAQRLGMQEITLAGKDPKFTALPIAQKQMVILTKGAEQLEGRINKIVEIVREGFGVKLTLGDLAIIFAASMGYQIAFTEKLGKKLPNGLANNAGMLMQAGITEIRQSSMKEDLKKRIH